jgi:gliding motility-associated transport system permease protein/gliding motility-associatede transport system auxiliary component
MATDSVARRVAQKEVLLFFASPVAWLFLASFAAVTLFVFFWVESFFARNIADIRPLFEWMPILLVFLSAALTMRMWSEERRTGTLEHILTQPVSLWHFVAGKFRACFVLLLLALVATVPLPVCVALMADLDWGPVVAAYVATCLLGATYLSIGLFISSRTDNPIVSLMGTVAVCGLLYLVGSPAITDFFDNRVGETLRLLGSGARFESITRGVIDARDLFYYLSLTIAFLGLNVYSLEKQRWARGRATPRHRYWRSSTLLLLANLIVANIWLAGIDKLRLDMTQGKLYSISQPTHEFLAQLQEPLLIRGYFSAKTHPLLSPLAPQLRDLMKEYEVAGKGKVRVQFIDPADHPDLEQEANERYGIHATPFQIADRHQSALVNSYFNILVQYGSEHETLGFSDLIEVRTAPNATAEVLLRNPEYDITRAIKDVMYNYRMGGSLFEGIAEPVEFIAYVSADERLPEPLLNYKRSISAQLEAAVAKSGGKFSVRFIEPEARDGAIARQIADEWGFRPMVSALDDEREFYFYLTLADPHQVVQLPTDNFDPVSFRLTLDAGLKRFASGFTKTVALVVPEVNPQMARYKLGGPTFVNLEQAISRDYSIRLEDLGDGSVAADADILAVVAPHQLDDTAVFAIDQFLMRGGTVIVASSPYTTEISAGEMRLQDYSSGLQDWLAHHGIRIADTLVLDQQNATFPAPVSRQAGEYTFHDVQMINYPYFIDLRNQGLDREHPVTGSLPQVTMAWASPIEVEPISGRQLTRLLSSSEQSWVSDSVDITPPVDSDSSAGERQQLGIVVQGRFDTFFSARPHWEHSGSEADNAQHPGIHALAGRSPESARIVLYSSNDFMDDQILNALTTASGTQYLGPIELFMNTLDWALQDDQLLQVRSRAHFNRTLPPMERQAQAIIEYLNYAMAVLWLALLALVHWVRKLARRRRYARGLGL